MGGKIEKRRKITHTEGRKGGRRYPKNEKGDFKEETYLTISSKKFKQSCELWGNGKRGVHKKRLF